MAEMREDMRTRSKEDMETYTKHEKLILRLNHTMPRTDEYQIILKELFGDRFGERAFLRVPLSGAAFDKMTIGNRVFINSNLLAMARGGITIEDDVQIAANVQLLSNNHAPYDRQRWIWIDVGIKIAGLVFSVSVFPPATSIAVLVTLLVLVIPNPLRIR